MEDSARNDTVSRATFEGAEMRAEIRDKRKDHIIIVLIVAILLNNLAWLWFINQFDVATETVTQELDSGNANYIGADGYINNDKSEGN